MTLRRIQNINEMYGDAVIVCGVTVDAAIHEMLRSLHDCGPDFQRIEALVEGIDFEVLDGPGNAAGK